jgi:hypothetical protein
MPAAARRPSALSGEVGTGSPQKTRQLGTVVAADFATGGQPTPGRKGRQRPAWPLSAASSASLRMAGSRHVHPTPEMSNGQSPFSSVA